MSDPTDNLILFFFFFLQVVILQNFGFSKLFQKLFLIKAMRLKELKVFVGLLWI